MAHDDFVLADALTKYQTCDSVAITSSSKSITYKDFFHKAWNVHVELERRSSGGRDFSVVGVAANSGSADTYAAIVGALLGGRCFVPLNPNNPKHRNQSIIDQTDITLVISDGPFEACTGTIEVLDLNQIELTNRKMKWPKVTEDQLAYILFTSGSTGTPKGVPISHENLSNFVQAVLADEQLSFSADDRFLQMFEMTFDLSVMCYILPLILGASVCLVNHNGVNHMQIFKTIGEHNVTCALMVPSVIGIGRAFLSRMSFPELRISMFCGEALVAEHLKIWSQAAPNASFHNLYGPTEATIYATSHRCEMDELDKLTHNGVVTIGSAIKGMMAIVLDPDGKEVPKGTLGELALEGPQVMRGYWNNPEKTAEVLIGGQRYLTGDLCVEDAEEGLIYYHGRKDSQVKIAGHRVELGEIEHFARGLAPDNADVVALDYAMGQDTRIALFGEGMNSTKLKEIVDELAKLLPNYMVPHVSHWVDAFPLNTSGKIDRRRLRDLLNTSDD